MHGEQGIFDEARTCDNISTCWQSFHVPRAKEDGTLRPFVKTYQISQSHPCAHRRCCEGACMPSCNCRASSKVTAGCYVVRHWSVSSFITHSSELYRYKPPSIPEPFSRVHPHVGGGCYRQETSSCSRLPYGREASSWLIIRSGSDCHVIS